MIILSFLVVAKAVANDDIAINRGTSAPRARIESSTLNLRLKSPPIGFVMVTLLGNLDREQIDLVIDYSSDQIGQIERLDRNRSILIVS